MRGSKVPSVSQVAKTVSENVLNIEGQNKPHRTIADRCSLSLREREERLTQQHGKVAAELAHAYESLQVYLRDSRALADNVRALDRRPENYGKEPSSQELEGVVQALEKPDCPGNAADARVPDQNGGGEVFAGHADEELAKVGRQRRATFANDVLDPVVGRVVEFKDCLYEVIGNYGDSTIYFLRQPGDPNISKVVERWLLMRLLESPGVVLSTAATAHICVLTKDLEQSSPHDASAATGAASACGSGASEASGACLSQPCGYLVHDSVTVTGPEIGTDSNEGLATTPLPTTCSADSDVPIVNHGTACSAGGPATGIGNQTGTNGYAAGAERGAPPTSSALEAPEPCRQGQ